MQFNFNGKIHTMPAYYDCGHVTGTMKRTKDFLGLDMENSDVLVDVRPSFEFIANHNHPEYVLDAETVNNLSEHNLLVHYLDDISAKMSDTEYTGSVVVNSKASSTLTRGTRLVDDLYWPAKNGWKFDCANTSHTKAWKSWSNMGYSPFENFINYVAADGKKHDTPKPTLKSIRFSNYGYTVIVQFSDGNSVMAQIDSQNIVCEVFGLDVLVNDTACNENRGGYCYEDADDELDNCILDNVDFAGATIIDIVVVGEAKSESSRGETKSRSLEIVTSAGKLEFCTYSAHDDRICDYSIRVGDKHYNGKM